MERATLSDILREVSHVPELQDRLARIVYNLGGGRMPTVFSTAVVSNLLTNAETVYCVTPPLNPGLDAALVLLIGMFATTAIGTNGTRLDLKIRQGTTVAGTLVGPATAPNTVVAGNAITVVTIGMDTPGAVAGLQYCISGQATGASVNTTPNSAFLMAMAIG